MIFTDEYSVNDFCYQNDIQETKMESKFKMAELAIEDKQKRAVKIGS